MSRFRSRWLALFGAVTLISLSLSTALAAKPDGENRGQQVSAFVHNLGADEETEEDTEVEEDTETEEDTEVEEEEQEEESAPSDHGQCVALVAQDEEAVGPPNDNHGGAVSEAARVTCWETGDEESADDSSSAPEHGNGHGHGHEK